MRNWVTLHVKFGLHLRRLEKEGLLVLHIVETMSLLVYSMFAHIVWLKRNRPTCANVWEWNIVIFIIIAIVLPPAVLTLWIILILSLRLSIIWLIVILLLFHLRRKHIRESHKRLNKLLLLHHVELMRELRRHHPILIRLWWEIRGLHHLSIHRFILDHLRHFRMLFVHHWRLKDVGKLIKCFCISLLLFWKLKKLWILLLCCSSHFYSDIIHLIE